MHFIQKKDLVHDETYNVILKNLIELPSISDDDTSTSLVVLTQQFNLHGWLNLVIGEFICN